MEIEVRIRGLMMDPSTNMPIVVLKEVGSETVMPIWVGIFEANAIAIEIEKLTAPRPMTHDLLRNLIRYLNAELEKVVITEIKDDTFHAVRPAFGCNRAGAPGRLSDLRFRARAADGEVEHLGATRGPYG
jgi:Domain of unknown function (DUF151)